MRFRGFLITAAFVPLLACGGGSGGSTGDTSGPVTTDPAASAGSTAGQQEPQAVEPSSMIVDLEARRVFLPGEGWLTEDAFWEIYHDHPEKLPGDIDFDALIELGYPDPPKG